MNKSIPIVGIAKRPDFTFDKYTKTKIKIENALKNHFSSREKDLPKTDDFFKDLEQSIQWSLFNQNLSEYSKDSRAKMKKDIENISLERIVIENRNGTNEQTKDEGIKEVVNKTPLPLKRWLYSKEISIHRAKTLHDVSKALRLFKEKVRKELSGRGREQYQIPVLLAADIANALKKVGINPVASRPIGISDPAIFYQIVQQCFRIAGLDYKDPYEHMKKSLNVQISENHPPLTP